MENIAHFYLSAFKREICNEPVRNAMIEGCHGKWLFNLLNQELIELESVDSETGRGGLNGERRGTSKEFHEEAVIL